MTDTHYRAAFERAKADLAKAVLAREKAVADAEAAHQDAIRLRRAVTALAAICGENIEDSMGLTEAVRIVLKEQTGEGWLNLTQIKAKVEELGASLSNLKNPDASVMSVLARLVTAKEVVIGTTKGKTGEVRFWKRATPSDSDPVTDDDNPF